MMRIVRAAVLFVLLVLLGLAGAAFYFAAGRGHDSLILASSFPDAKLQSCTRAGDVANAVVAITNASPSRRSFFVTVGFVSSDGKTQYDTRIVHVENVPPGQKTITGTSAPLPAGGKCTIVAVI
jgi:hypothetical protein